MKIALISDVFPPLRSSGAVQLRDLAKALGQQQHDVTVIVASPEIEQIYQIEHVLGVRVARLKTCKAKEGSYFKRAIAEFLMPFLMGRALKLSGLEAEHWDAVVWYSPTIFLGALIQKFKSKNKCSSYLIVRDIFPEWALDMGLMRPGLPYWIFKGLAAYQYSVADTIGIQTPGNAKYFDRWLRKSGRSLEVLHNWLGECESKKTTINLAETELAERKLFVYAGNMGIAQGMGVLLALAQRFSVDDAIGFVFVGRGSDLAQMKLQVQRNQLKNVLFFDEIDPDEISALYAQCHVGLVALDARHKSHNIPGKFLTYMQSGLPALAAVNKGNDLIDLIHRERVGRACASDDLDALYANAKALLHDIEVDTDFYARCRSLNERMFSAQAAAHQIVDALKNKK